jgi:hypothetical protein
MHESMSSQIQNIQEAIKANNYDHARALLQQELQQRPSPMAYRLASSIAVSEAQRAFFLQKATELEAFHNPPPVPGANYNPAFLPAKKVIPIWVWAVLVMGTLAMLIMGGIIFTLFSTGLTGLTNKPANSTVANGSKDNGNSSRVLATAYECLPEIKGNDNTTVVQACVTPFQPNQLAKVTVYGRLIVKGKPAQGAVMGTIWNYAFLPEEGLIKANSSGIAIDSRSIGIATPGYRVKVDVLFEYNGTIYQVPVDPANPLVFVPKG